MQDTPTKPQKATSGKRDKFVKLAENRTKNAIRAIRVIAKLANKSAYDYDESDVRQIISALSRELEGLKARMSSTQSKETIEFRLK